MISCERLLSLSALGLIPLLLAAGVSAFDAARRDLGQILEQLDRENFSCLLKISAVRELSPTASAELTFVRFYESGYMGVQMAGSPASSYLFAPDGRRVMFSIASPQTGDRQGFHRFYFWTQGVFSQRQPGVPGSSISDEKLIDDKTWLSPVYEPYRRQIASGELLARQLLELAQRDDSCEPIRTVHHSFYEEN